VHRKANGLKSVPSALDQSVHLDARQPSGFGHGL
jgi:hypothetical protein